MRRYTILSIGRTVGATENVYSAVRQGNEYTGDYTCGTLEGAERTKIVTDFICMNNTRIISIKDETRRNILTDAQSTFTLGETTTQGRISGFKLNRNNVEVYLNNARVNTVLLSTLTKPVVMTAAATTAVRPVVTTPNTTAPSRSQLTNNEFTTLEQKISTAPDIRLEKLLKKNIPATLEDFLIKFFKTYNREKDTIFVETKEVQTNAGRRRSLGDMYKICKYYFPDTTLRDMLILLYRRLPLVLTNGFRTSYCNTIRKRVWYYAPGEQNTVANADHNDEYDHTVRWYTDKI